MDIPTTPQEGRRGVPNPSEGDNASVRVEAPSRGSQRLTAWVARKNAGLLEVKALA